jgi:hypothetical protein
MIYLKASTNRYKLTKAGRVETDVEVTVTVAEVDKRQEHALLARDETGAFWLEVHERGTSEAIGVAVLTF